MNVGSSQIQLNILSSPVKAELSAGYTKTWSEARANGNSSSLDSEDINPISLSANFNVIPYGPLYEQIIKARLNLRLAKNNLKDQKNAEIIKLYQTLSTALIAKEQIRLAEARLEQAQINSKQSHAELLLSQENYKQSLQSVFLMSGQEFSKLKTETIKLADFDYLLEQAIEKRTDVLSASFNLIKAKIDAESNLRENLPYGTISSNYIHSTENEQLSFGGSFSTKSFQAGLQASYDPDFEPRNSVSGQTADSISISVKLVLPLDATLPDALKLSELMIDQAELKLEQSRNLARLDIAAKENSVSISESKLAFAASMLEQSKQNLEIAKTRFEAGIVSKLDLLSAKIDLLDAKTSFEEAKKQSLMAKMQLASALSLNLLEVIK